jgi:acetyltransferase-like isoleucine patch superfamily enzyme
MGKSIFRKINKFILNLLYKDLNNDSLSTKAIYQMAFFQKILRINSNVPWPVHWSSRVDVPEKIKIGTECPGYMPGCYFDGRNGIVLHENVTIGPNVNFISQNHDILDFDKYISASPIIIGKNSWIGAGVTILPGVELGEHTIVGANAVVTKSFTGSNQIIAGNPAKRIKQIETYKG